MKQVLQHLRSGETVVAGVPLPGCGGAAVLIRSRATLISAGTERMLVEFGKSGLLGKARAQPEKVRQALDKIRTDGLLPTLETVFNRLDEPMPLGYCNAGVVVEQGAGSAEQGEQSREQGAGSGEVKDQGPRSKVQGPFQVGERVASNGPHAEFVAVPRNLCARIPDSVTDEQAAFTVLASIGLQGVRLLAPTLGERVVVVGLGLIGLMTVQLLQANGCQVLGIDINQDRLRLAERWGASVVNPALGGDPVAAAMSWTAGKGMDGVLITASAKTDDIVHQAAQMCRKRGRIVLVGVVGLNLRRADFYEKELTFQVSCSYGPGRYDEKYEQGGQDYPFGYVRWTEQRNFEAVLDLMATGRLRVDELITHRFPLERAPEAYDLISHDPSALGVILEYPAAAELDRTVATGPNTKDEGLRSEEEGTRTKDQGLGTKVHGPWSLVSSPAPSAGGAIIGVLGAGNFSKMTLMPGLAKTSVRIKFVCDLNGVAAAHLARKFGAENATTDSGLLFTDPDVNTVFVAVGHHLHARFVCEALQAGKHVFVEKPLAMNVEEVRQIVQAYKRGAGSWERVAGSREQGAGSREQGAGSREQGAGSREQGAGSNAGGVRDLSSGLLAPSSPLLLMVGFNRRFSPHTARLKQLLGGRSEPLAINITVNAGAIPPDHWVHDPVRGGGRIVGEACHFIDLMVHLTGSPVRTVVATMVGAGSVIKEDKMSIVLGFEDGSVGTVNYFANGSKAYPKETVEVFSEGRVARIENFRRLSGYGFRGFSSLKTWRQDKGHRAEFEAYVKRVAECGPPLIPLDDLVNVTLASFAAMTAAREERMVHLDDEYEL